MGDLISRTAAIEAILGSFSAIKAIEELPAVDAVPIKIPKVMTWQEIVESANEYDGEKFVWLESKDNPERVFPSILFKTWVYDAIATIITVMTTGWLFEGYEVEYNKRWRIWTEKPTEEQRKEAKWE